MNEYKVIWGGTFIMSKEYNGAVCLSCGETIKKGTKLCGNGHRQYWCPNPECGAQILDLVMCSCPDCGQEFLWCNTCQSLVVPKQGRFCPIHGTACYQITESQSR